MLLVSHRFPIVSKTEDVGSEDIVGLSLEHSTNSSYMYTLHIYLTKALASGKNIVVIDFPCPKLTLAYACATRDFISRFVPRFITETWNALIRSQITYYLYKLNINSRIFPEPVSIAFLAMLIHPEIESCPDSFREFLLERTATNRETFLRNMKFNVLSVNIVDNTDRREAVLTRNADRREAVSSRNCYKRMRVVLRKNNLINSLNDRRLFCS